jgi:hypothetical protein
VKHGKHRFGGAGGACSWISTELSL